MVLNLYRRFSKCSQYAPQLLVTSWHHSKPVTAIEQELSVVYMRLRSPVSGTSTFGALAKWLVKLIPELRSLARYLRSSRVAVVNIHFPSLAAIQFIMVKRLFIPRMKVILSFHGMDIVNAAATNGLERALWRFLLRSADACVGCSDALTKSIHEFYTPAKPVITIHNGLDIDHVMQERNADAILHENLAKRLFLLSVAALEHKKGLDTLIRAFRSVKDQCGIDIALALVGPERGVGSELRRLTEELGLEESVVFCGEVPHADLHVYYKRATIFCLTSRVEPFGIVLLEAGAFGCPVVATDVGGIPEIITHGKTGRLFPAEDVEALARELLDLLSDTEERQRLGQSLCNHVREKFSWQAAADAYLRLTRVNP